MRRTSFRLFLAACLMVAAAACGDSSGSDSESPRTEIAPGTGATVRWGTSSMPTSLDPATSGGAAYSVFMWLLYDRLVYAEPNGELQPMLATEWVLSDDARTLDLTLRDGVTFQDGAPFDADAVVTNIAHMMDDSSLTAGSLAMVDDVKAVDPTHVRFTLNRPGGDLPQVLSGFAGMMVSPASIEAGTASTDPVGAGPYKIGTVSDASISFTYWDGYWDAESIIPKAVEVSVLTDDAARLNGLKAGQLDAAIIRPNQLAEAEAASLKTYSVPAATAYGVQVNAANPALSDPDVRRAISQAIDRESITQYLYDGECEVSAQPYPSDYWAHNGDIDEETYTAFDPDAAAAAIEKAAPDGLSLTILTPNVTAYQRLSEVLQEQLADVGIDAAVEAVDYADLLARGRRGDYDLIVTLMTSGGPDPSTWAEQNYRVSPAGSDYIDPRLPELIEQARTSVDLEDRGEAMGKVTEAALEAGTNQIVVCLPSNTFASVANATGFKINDPRALRVD